MGRDREKEPSILRIFPRDPAKFHQFWTWEYLRRNSKYRRVYDEYTQNLKKLDLTDDNPVPSQEQISNFTAREQRVLADINMAPKAFIKKFKMWPRDYFNGVGPTELISEILLYQKEGLTAEKSGLYADIDNIVPVEAVRLEDYKWPFLSLTVQMNLEDDLEVLLNELSVIYHNTKHSHYVSAGLQKDDLDKAEKEKTFELEKKAAESERKLVETKYKLRKRGHPPDALPRAVGLWLWDHFKKSGGKHGAMQKAVDAFSVEVDSENSPIYMPEPDKYKEPKRLREMLRITKQCVKEVAVHPMK